MSNPVAVRIELCKACDRLNKLNFCSECGCFMPAKVRFKSASCPIGKWGRVETSQVPDNTLTTNSNQTNK